MGKEKSEDAITFAFVFDMPSSEYLSYLKNTFKPVHNIFSTRHNIHFDMITMDLASYEFTVWMQRGIIAKVWGKIEPVGLNQTRVTGEIILEIPLAILISFSVVGGISIVYGLFAPSIPMLIFALIWLTIMAFSTSQARQQLIDEVLENLQYPAV